MTWGQAGVAWEAFAQAGDFGGWGAGKMAVACPGGQAVGAL